MALNKPRRFLAVIAAMSLLSVLSGIVYAQRFFGGGRFVPFQIQPNQKYDGRFTFVRVKYETAPGGYWWRGQPSWAHGYPTAEANLMQIMNNVSYLNGHPEIDTVTLDDPELFKYPLVYI